MRNKKLESAQIVQITSILADAMESISVITKTSEERAREIKAIINNYKDTHTRRPYSRPAKYNFQIPEYAQAPFMRAIEIAGNVNRLSDLCHTPSARLYEITRGVCAKVSHALAKRIHIATDGQVKAWELNSEIEKSFDPCVDI